MALTREEKEKLVDAYVEKFASSEALFFVDYRGLKVSDLSKLRGQLRNSGNSFVVVKNTLAQIALERAGQTVPADLFAGPVAIGICQSDIASVAKTLNQVAQETRLLTIKGAVVGNSILAAEQAKSLADLPSREELLAKIVGSMQAPISGLVNVLSGTMRGLVTVLKARAGQLTA